MRNKVRPKSKGPVSWIFADKLRGNEVDFAAAKRKVEAWANGEPEHALKAASLVYDETRREVLVAVKRGVHLVLSWKKA